MMETILDLAALVGFGACFGGVAITYAVIHSTLAAAPDCGASVGSHIRVSMIRLLFLAFAMGSLTLVRPLRLSLPDDALSPIAGLLALFVMVFVGMKHVAPKFVTMKLTTPVQRK